MTLAMSPESRGDEMSVLSTLSLADRASYGDERARDALHARYLPRLRRWARERLPRNARDLIDTDALVQETLDDTLRRGQGASFLGSVRKAVDDRIAGEIRTTYRKDVAPTAADPRDLYEQAFQRLTLSEQAAIAARLEEGMSYEEIAQELGNANAEAARLAVSRALLRLAQEMKALRRRSQ
jgi:RNA polymerase sigma-70 factor (ECF subfamily)